MKLFGLIAVVLITFSACQKENLSTPAQKGASSAETRAAKTAGRPESGTEATNPGGGIVDPNADQDASSATKLPKKGK